ncbi:MAG: DNA recombination protein RmuC [Acidimicrobiia bacterium]
MDGLLVVLGVLVVPSIVAASVGVVLGRRRGRPAAQSAEAARDAAARAAAERDAAVHSAIDHLVRVNQEMLAGERRLGTADLEGAKSLIDLELVEMRSDLQQLTGLLQQLEQERRQHTGELSSQLAEAGRHTRALADTTQSLREALSSTSARGQWGERMADDVLRLAGFVDGINYHRHRPIAGTGGIPDYTFLLPQGLCVHMDVKFPLSNYLRHLDATSDIEREHHRRAFLKDVRLRLREVTTREYVDPSANTVDCVLLFIPNEQVYAFIQEQDRDVLDDALRQKVVFCSPLTLFAVLAVIRQAVDNFRVSQTSQEILAVLHGFQKQWDKFVEQMDKVGRSLKTAGHAFDELEGARRRQLERELDKIDAVRRDQRLDITDITLDPAAAPSLALEA